MAACAFARLSNSPRSTSSRSARIRNIYSLNSIRCACAYEMELVPMHTVCHAFVATRTRTLWEKRMARKYSKSTSKDVERELRAYKRGKLKSGSGQKVKSRKQAIAIGLSEARKKGKEVPKRKNSKSRKKRR